MPSQFTLAVFFVLTAELSFTSMAVVVKMAASHLPNESIVFFRNFFVMLFLLPWILPKTKQTLATDIPHLHILRSLSGLSSMYCYYYAIGNIPLSEAALLKQTSPFFIPFITFFWFGERIYMMTAWAILLGFIGVVIILRPDADVSSVAWIGVVGSMFAALSKSSIRRMSATEPSIRIVFYFTTIGAIVSAIPMTWAWVTPDAHALLLMFLLAVFGTIAQLCMTKGFKLAPTSQLAVFTYASIIFATIYGWIFWQEWIDYRFFIGAILIFAAGVLITSTHRRYAKT
ncbi:DMT family transporter [Candidatus Albibeggiatoa sp. nov. NOAA]|uniref:DMT family transporter n=1 Tax=Candidatus Albibeggiatoa sp. nov. NOAA TaxID=3162724 RepID=UPI0032F5D6B3|nr:DMT family transporter [Thiotrichaceae bacterium]